MARRDLWPEVEPLLSRVERPARYLNHEWGCAAPVAEDDFALVDAADDGSELFCGGVLGYETADPGGEGATEDAGAGVSAAGSAAGSA